MHTFLPLDGGHVLCGGVNEVVSEFDEAELLEFSTDIGLSSSSKIIILLTSDTSVSNCELDYCAK